MMRKKLLLASLLGMGLTVPALAQTEQGSKLIGVNAGNLNYSSHKDERHFSAGVTPSAGVFVADNLLLGADVQLGYSRWNRGTDSQKNTSRYLSYGLSPFARYYLPGTGRHRFFGQVSAGVHWNSYRAEYGFVNQPLRTESSTLRSFTYGAALGYNYFLSQNAAFEVTAGYNRFTNNQSDNNVGELDIRAGFSLFLSSRKAATTPTN